MAKRQSRKKTPAAKTDEAAVVEPKKKAASKRYWVRPVHFEEFGTVSGLVLKKHLDAFLAMSPDSDIEKWTLDHDPEAKRLASAKKKMREQVGLD